MKPLTKCIALIQLSLVLINRNIFCTMMEYELKLLDAVSTFKLLDGVDITDNERKLALTVCSVLNFDRMKSELKGLFLKSSLNPNVNVKIKQEEEALYSKRHNFQQDFQHPKYNGKFKQVNKINPVNKIEKFPGMLYVIRDFIGQINALTKMIKMLILSKEGSDHCSGNNDLFVEANIVLIETLSKL